MALEMANGKMRNPSGQTYVQLLRTFLRPQWRRVGLLAALLAAGIGLQLVNPQVIRFFIDTAQSARPDAQGALAGAAVVFMAVALTRQALGVAANYMAADVGWTATNALRSELALHLLRLDLSFHKTHTPGELIERVDGDVTALANFFSEFVVRVLANTLLAAAILVLLFREDWRVGLGLALYAGVTLVGLAALQRTASGRWSEARQASAGQFGFLEERLSGPEDIRANGAEAYTLNRLYGLMREVLRTTRAARVLQSMTAAFSNLVYVIAYGIGLATGTYLYSRGEASIGTAFLIVNYIGMLAGPLQGIREQAQDLQQAAGSIGRVQELFRLAPRGRQRAGRALPAGPLRVEFDRVWFGYRDGPAVEPGAGGEEEAQVLRGISFQLERGQTVGVLGRTGSGKTTLARLLFRLYEPARGSIRLEGVELGEVGLEELRARVGMVTQDVQLFQASLRDNLRFFNAGRGDEEIERALGELGLVEWVRGLPQGLDTPLGGSGRGMSAGEAQLLALTRVFLKDPGLVILDEASARLDPATERLLERSLDRLLGARRTGIVIAHRLQTVQRADMILILEAGQVVEFGARQALAADPGSRFSRLLRTGLEEALA